MVYISCYVQCALVEHFMLRSNKGRTLQLCRKRLRDSVEVGWLAITINKGISLKIVARLDKNVSRSSLPSGT